MARDPPIPPIGSYILGLFKQEMFMQIMNRKAKRSWRWLQKDNNIKKIKYELTPENGDRCIFNLGRISFVTEKVSNKSQLFHRLTTASLGPTRFPNALLVLLLTWAETGSIVQPSGINVLFGRIDEEEFEMDKAIYALMQLAKAVQSALVNVKLLEDRLDLSMTINYFEKYNEACQKSELWYGVLQDWAIGKPGGIVFSRLIAE